jgi:membrane protein implicated in regulation of membrane protease activity
MPLLPRGALAALKGHYDGIVTVVGLAITAGGMTAGASPVWLVLALAVALLLYHFRRKDSEKHDEYMARNRIDAAMVKVEAIKARHRELLLVEQPSLRLENRPRTRAARKGET